MSNSNNLPIIQSNTIRLKQIEDYSHEMIKSNDENVIKSDYDRGYNEGYHDAFVDVMNHFGINHSEEYRS